MTHAYLPPTYALVRPKPARRWTLPSAEEQSRYATGVLTSQVSTLPGLTVLEAESAAAYLRTLPMRRDRSITATWLALSPDVRAEWVDRTRAVFEAFLIEATG